MDLINDIMNKYAASKGVGRKIAQYLLKDPQGFLTKDAKDLGIATKTSGASIVRFCQQNGFSGISDFKLALARSLPTNTAPAVDTIIAADEHLSHVVSQLTRFVVANTRETAKRLDMTIYQAAINVLRNAHCIYLEGIAASSLPAEDLYYKLSRAGKLAVFEQDAHLALVRSYYTQASDVMVIFSYSGLTKEVLLAGKQAKANGATVIAITRMGVSPLIELADLVISLPASEQLLRVGAVSSLFAEMFVSSLLFLGLMNQQGPHFMKRYQETETLTDQLKVTHREEENGN